MIYDTFFALLVRFDLQPFIDNNILDVGLYTFSLQGPMRL